MVVKTHLLLKCFSKSILNVLIIILSCFRDVSIKAVVANHSPVLNQSCDASKSSIEVKSRGRRYSRHIPIHTYATDNNVHHYTSNILTGDNMYLYESYNDYDLVFDNNHPTDELKIGKKNKELKKDSKLKKRKNRNMINSYNKDYDHSKFEIYDGNKTYLQHRSLRKISHINMNNMKTRSQLIFENKTKETRPLKKRSHLNQLNHRKKQEFHQPQHLCHTQGRIVNYNNHQKTPHNQRFRPISNAFITSIKNLKSNIPSPKRLSRTAVASLSTAREKTSQLSTSLYREAKGLASSELEMVLLKATRPDNTPVKSKHVERLVGVTYQISSRYDIYDAVLRKLWNKMVEEDWRTVIKSLYVLHRFSVDGCIEHGKALRGRFIELKHSRDVKRGKRGMYFARSLILKLDGKGDSNKYKKILSKYTRYVLLRTQCFSGMFSEIDHTRSNLFSSLDDVDQNLSLCSESTYIPYFTSTNLNQDNLDAAKLVLRAGVACSALSCEKYSEHIAVAIDCLVKDLIGLVNVVGNTLNVALTQHGINKKNENQILLDRWCDFYIQTLLPQTKQVIRITMPLLDRYGLYLPSRNGKNLKNELLVEGSRVNNYQNIYARKRHNENKTRNINNIVIHNAVNENELNREDNKKFDNLPNYDLDHNITECEEYYDW